MSNGGGSPGERFGSSRFDAGLRFAGPTPTVLVPELTVPPTPTAVGASILGHIPQKQHVHGLMGEPVIITPEFRRPGPPPPGEVYMRRANLTGTEGVESIHSGSFRWIVNAEETSELNHSAIPTDPYIEPLQTGIFKLKIWQGWMMAVGAPATVHWSLEDAEGKVMAASTPVTVPSEPEPWGTSPIEPIEVNWTAEGIKLEAKKRYYLWLRFSGKIRIPGPAPRFELDDTGGGTVAPPKLQAGTAAAGAQIIGSVPS